MALWKTPSRSSTEQNQGLGLPIGSQHYRAFVGPPEKYDLVAANQFSLLNSLGLRDYDRLLDIGCGSLRAGRLFIPYLLPGNYYGLEPATWLVKEGIKKEIGRDLLKIKQPVFSNDSNFTLTRFGVMFDYLLAQSVFSHASQKQIARCLSEAKKVMHRESKFAATYVGGNENYAGDDWVYPECCEYTEDRMLQLAREAGLAAQPYSWPHPNGQRWLLILNQG